MAEHDFRYTLLNPQHTLIECRSLAPGRYQVTGNGGSIQEGDRLIVTLKGSRTLSMTLTVEKVRHIISPPGQWVAVANGPAFKELAIFSWTVNCNRCNNELEFEFALEANLPAKARPQAAQARIMELGWQVIDQEHICPNCQKA